MSDNEFYLGIWKVVGCALFGVAAVIGVLSTSRLPILFYGKGNRKAT
jgi:hypothetical protein